MQYVPLKISHPLAPWLFALTLVALGGLYFVVMGVQVLPEGGGIVIGELFWGGLLLYAISAGVFLYIWIAPRFKHAPAGVANLQRLETFIRSYPDIASTLGLRNYCREDATYGALKRVQKKANRQLIQVASQSLFHRS